MYVTERKTQQDRFEEHIGPVRGIHFHPTQPLFVSGGDDYTIKVWNYQTKKCQFTLKGHTDYIRTVQFHHEHPWILSASDDLTIKLWNWQSRTCIYTMVGHSHYVMCARFHTTENLIVSASLDGTARIWDFSGQLKHGPQINNMLIDIDEQYRDIHRISYITNTDINNTNNDTLNYEIITKHILEGHHIRGLNWATFHPKLPQIVTSSDDHELCIWRLADDLSCSWLVDTLYGHTNHVVCSIFHPTKDFILSVSEDKTLRIWDVSKNHSPLIIKRENDTFWMVESHPNRPLFAAGHDSGIMIFKLYRERVPFYILPRYINTINSSIDYDNEKIVKTIIFIKGQNIYKCIIGKRRPILSKLGTLPRTYDMNAIGDNSDIPTSIDINVYTLEQQVCVMLFSPNSIFDLFTQNIPLSINTISKNKTYTDEIEIESDEERSEDSKEQQSQDTIDPLNKRIKYYKLSSLKFIDEKKQDEDKQKQQYINTLGIKSGTFLSSSRFVIIEKNNKYNVLSISDQPLGEKRREQYIIGQKKVFKGSCVGRQQQYCIGTNPVQDSSRGRVLIDPREISDDTVTTIDNNNNNNNGEKKINAVTNSAKEYYLVHVDINQNKVYGDSQIPTKSEIKQIVWDDDNKYVCIYSKHSLIIYTERLCYVVSIHEPKENIKTVIWYNKGICIYNTSYQIKYIQQNGTNGILCTQKECIYMISINDNTIWFFDRNQRLGKLNINTIEQNFKWYLYKKDRKQVINMQNSQKLLGQSMIRYLQQNGYPEIALYYVKDIYIRFNLAQQCGNQLIAKNCAIEQSEKNKDISKNMIWELLGKESQRQGQFDIAERCYIELKQLNSQIWQYQLTGNNKLYTLLKIAYNKQSSLQRFQVSLQCGELNEILNISNEQGFIIKNNKNLLKQDQINKDIGEDFVPEGFWDMSDTDKDKYLRYEDRKLCIPPPIINPINMWLDDNISVESLPLYIEDIYSDWVNTSAISEAETATAKMTTTNITSEIITDNKSIKSPLEMEIIKDIDTNKEVDMKEKNIEQKEHSAWDEQNVDELDDIQNLKDDNDTIQDKNIIKQPNNGVPLEYTTRIENDNITYLIAKGQFIEMKYQQEKRWGIYEQKLQKEYILYQSQYSNIYIQGQLGCPSQKQLLFQKINEKNILLHTPNTLNIQNNDMKQGKEQVTKGYLDKSKIYFLQVQRRIPFINVLKDELEPFIIQSSSYLRVLRLESERSQQDSSNNGTNTSIKNAEMLTLACTISDIETRHLVLFLWLSIKYNYGQQNLRLVQMLCRWQQQQMGSISNDEQVLKKQNIDTVKKIIHKCETQSESLQDTQPLGFDVNRILEGKDVICSRDLVAISINSSGRCSYCTSPHSIIYKGNCCAICSLGRVEACDAK